MQTLSPLMQRETPQSPHTLLPLTYHPKYYHKLVRACQASHTVGLCSSLPCKDSSVWEESGANGEELVTMAFYTRRKTNCGVLRFVACGGTGWEHTWAHCNNYRAVFEADEKCVLKSATSLRAACLAAWQIVPFFFAPVSVKIEESIEV